MLLTLRHTHTHTLTLTRERHRHKVAAAPSVPAKLPSVGIERVIMWRGCSIVWRGCRTVWRGCRTVMSSGDHVTSHLEVVSLPRGHEPK